MQTYDIIMLVVLAAAAGFGAWKGFAWQIASLGAIVASYVMAMRYREPVSRLIHAEAPWNKFAAMLILYVGTSLVIWIIFRIVSRTIDRVQLKEFDRQIGALFGLAKGLVLCVLITLFSVTLVDEARRRSIIQSRSGYYLTVFMHKSQSVMPPELHRFLEPYLKPFDEQLHPAPQRIWDRYFRRPGNAAGLSVPPAYIRDTPEDP